MKSRTQGSNRRVTGPSGLKPIFALFGVLAIVLASLGLSSCAGYSTAASSGGGGTGSTGTSGAGVLSANANTVNFGGVAVGSNATQTVSVTNTGTATVNVSQATVSGTGFTIVGGNPAATIPVGQSASVQVQFAPTAPGSASGNFTVMSDASDSPMTVALSGTGMQPGLQMSPASLSFSNITVGQT